MNPNAPTTIETIISGWNTRNNGIKLKYLYLNRLDPRRFEAQELLGDKVVKLSANVVMGGHIATSKTVKVSAEISNALSRPITRKQAKALDEKFVKQREERMNDPEAPSPDLLFQPIKNNR